MTAELTTARPTDALNIRVVCPNMYTMLEARRIGVCDLVSADQLNDTYPNIADLYVNPSCIVPNPSTFRLLEPGSPEIARYTTTDPDAYNPTDPSMIRLFESNQHIPYDVIRKWQGNPGSNWALFSTECPPDMLTTTVNADIGLRQGLHYDAFDARHGFRVGLNRGPANSWATFATQAVVTPERQSETPDELNRAIQDRIRKSVAGTVTALCIEQLPGDIYIAHTADVLHDRACWRFADSSASDSRMQSQCRDPRDAITAQQGFTTIAFLSVGLAYQ